MADAEVRDETLLIAQRNEVFRLAIDVGLDPSMFRWDESEGGGVRGQQRWRYSVLRYDDSSYYCEFRHWSDWDLQCSPCGDLRAGRLQAGNWTGTLIQVKNWLERLAL